MVFLMNFEIHNIAAWHLRDPKVVKQAHNKY